MKTQFLYTATAILFGTMLWLGNSSGPGLVGNGDRTGRTSFTCGDCHGGGSFSATPTITVKDSMTGSTVTAYEAGKTYQIVISSAGGASKYGFQTVAINASGASVGTMRASTGMHTTTIGGRSYMEHSSASSSPTFSFYWVAPATAGTGSVTWHLGYLLANGTGGDGGDAPKTTFAVLTETIPSSIQEVSFANTYTLYPNPTSSQLHLQLDITQAGEYSLEITNVWGVRVLQQQFTFAAGQQTQQIATQDLAAGMYIASIRNSAGQIASRSFVKE